MGGAHPPIAGILTPNIERLEKWRQKMRQQGRYYDLAAHVKQKTAGVNWDRRILDARFHTGRLRMGPDGFLPRE